MAKKKEKGKEKDTGKDEKGLFTSGNQFWKLRIKPPKEDEYVPQDFIDMAIKYFEWSDENPITIADNKGTRNVNMVDKIRPLGIARFCIFSGISTKTFYKYEKKKGFEEALCMIKDYIRAHQTEMATIGEYKENIVSRILQISDKQVLEVAGTDLEKDEIWE